MEHSHASLIFRNYGRWIKNDNDQSGEKAVAMFSKGKSNAIITSSEQEQS
jgi:hypothetical protein